MNVVGKTAEGVNVMGGVFAMYDTCGLPFGVLFARMAELGMFPCWFTFVRDAKKAGWKDKKILSEIDYGLRDAGLVELAEVVTPVLAGLSEHDLLVWAVERWLAPTPGAP